MKKTLIVLIIAIAAVIVFCVLFFDRCPESCTTDYLQKWFDSAQYPCGVSFDGIDRTENTSLLAEMMSFSEWQKIRKPSSGEKELITIIMSEEYEITVYESYVKVHDGYSRIGEAEDVFYSVPENVIEKITNYKNSIASGEGPFPGTANNEAVEPPVRLGKISDVSALLEQTYSLIQPSARFQLTYEESYYLEMEPTPIVVLWKSVPY